MPSGFKLSFTLFIAKLMVFPQNKLPKHRAGQTPALARGQRLREDRLKCMGKPSSLTTERRARGHQLCLTDPAQVCSSAPSWFRRNTEDLQRNFCPHGLFFHLSKYDHKRLLLFLLLLLSH